MSSNSVYVEILKKFVKIGSYLSFAPFELNSHNSDISKYRKFGAVFNLLAQISGIIFSLYGRVFYKFRNELPYELFLDFTAEFLLFLSSFTICASSNFVYSKNYRTFFDLILEIDQISNVKLIIVKLV